MNAKNSDLLHPNWMDVKVHPVEYLKEKAKEFCDIMAQDIGGISAWKILLGIVSFFVAVNTSVVGYLVVNQVDVQKGLIELSASRMSSSKGDEIVAKLSELNVKVEGLPKENPPVYVLDLIRRNEADINKLKDKVEALQLVNTTGRR